MICPKCQYQRQLKDASVHPELCPACGIAYKKWQAKRKAEEQAVVERAEAFEQYLHEAPLPSLRERLLYRFFFMPSDRHESAFWGHVLIYVIFFFWGWSFILNGLEPTYIFSSFLHNANLAFHEYGHLMFSVFGELSMFLGGSLFQILLPFHLLIFFTFYRRDNFAASIMLWWTGQNFIDVSPYIFDAPTRYLPLVGGGGINSHDWWNILRMTGQMELSTFYAWLWFCIGALLIIGSQFWGAALLYVELEGRGVINHPEDDEEGYEG